VTTIRPLVHDVPGLSGFVAVAQDVTNRRVLEERLRQGQKLEAIGRLAGGIAHDFNNLLAVILGHADWIERELAGKGPVAEVTGIQEAAERAADLTRRLPAFSRRSAIQPADLNLTLLVTDMLPMLRRLIGGDIEIIDETSPTLPTVTGDRSQLQQVLMNLAVNARDAMPDGGTLTVRTAEIWLESDGAVQTAGRHVLLEVKDTGIGMDAATRRLAYEPFYTTKDVGQGTGLGLSTVYGIVQQLGGRIQLESEPGRGTSIRLYFPETPVAAQPVAPTSLDSLIGPNTLM
jgi:signal transduction histidine kinase